MSVKKFYVICEDECFAESLTKEEIFEAIAEATGNTPTTVGDAFITQIVDQNGGGNLKLWKGTQQEYNAIATPDPHTWYIITDAVASGGAGEGAVRYDETQTLGDNDKARARENIGAQAELDFDTVPTEDSTKMVRSGAVFDVTNASVKYTEQALTDEQKLQARKNIGAEFVNDNLLMNWDWRTPIRQRGVFTGVDYSKPSGENWIDRWYLVRDATWNSGAGVTIKPSGSLAQILEINPLSTAGKTFTISIMIGDACYSTQLNIPSLAELEAIPAGRAGAISVTLNGVFVTWLFSHLSSGTTVRICNEDCSWKSEIEIENPYNDGNGDDITIKAVKLEEGATSTLAHQEGGIWVTNNIVDYGAELLKCQRYFQRFRTQSLRAGTYADDYRPVMRDDPTTDTIVIGEGGVMTTWYYADAEFEY